jgi:hypothetical protein
MRQSTLVWTLILVAAGLWLAYRTATVGVGQVYVQRAGGLTRPATPAEFENGLAELSWPRTGGVWVAALLTLCIFSFLYRDNVFYKLAEAITVGVTAAYWMVVGFWSTIVPNLFGKLFPEAVQSWAMPGLSPVRDEDWYLYFIPLVLGILLLWRLSPRGAWVGRWPLAFVIGTFAGLRLLGFLHADFLSQIRNSLIPLVVMQEGTVSVGQSLAHAVTLVGILSGIVYFFFSFEHKGLVGGVARVGIWVLMITFGAAFGYTVMGRIALLAIRFEFLFGEWLKLT